MTIQKSFKATAISVAVASVLAAPGLAGAQDAEAEAVGESAEQIEEITVTGRFISSSQQLVNERMTDAFSIDTLGEDTISRLGDSTVGAALRRVPGLTLVQDKFVYIRGLGERYSQSTLNGAQIPSPDLTRNVIPLDVFPTTVVQSLRVQKSWAPSLSANFGGGAVDIRTKGIPDALTLKFEVGLGTNSENPSSMISYAGGGDDDWGTDDGTRALAPSITDGIIYYQGNPSVNQIFSSLQQDDPYAQFYDAQTINRDFALALNRNVSITQEDADPDVKLRASVGNKWDLGTNWQAGFAVGGAYETDWRWRRTRTADWGQPDTQNGVREESTRAVNIAGTANFGLSWLEDHDIETTSLFLRNTDDETEIYDFFNENRIATDGRGFRDYRLQFEEREMTTHQVKGTHYFGSDTRDSVPFMGSLLRWFPEETKVEWFYSTSEAVTEIPNQVEIASDTITDRSTGEVLSESVRLISSAADYRFTDLDDEVEHWGWSGALPIEFGDSIVELTGGWDHSQKSRTYRQVQISLGYLSVADPSVLQGSLGDVFSDANITADVPDPDPTNPVPDARVYVNNVVFDRQGTNTNSYLAATMTDSTWGQVDWTWQDTWRIAAGARYEDYRQVAIGWNPYAFGGDTQIPTDVEELEEAAFADDKVYPSAAITYMGSLWAETFQVRLGYSETAIRPDLREITGSSYIDPITGELVFGNPGVIPAEFQNIDLRAEWFFENGDNLTVTLFQKDIEHPIEFFEIPASDTTIAREIINAESGEVKGIEVEFLKELGFLGGFWDTMFVQGNVTLQDSELVAGEDASSPTNPVRQLTGASDYVANFMIGFDSPNTKHTASLIYNVFGERMYVAGRLGEPDGFEQPFHSLDFTYFWYPTDRLTLKLKAQNILGDAIEITRYNEELDTDVIVFEEDPGSSYSATVSWSF